MTGKVTVVAVKQVIAETVRNLQAKGDSVAVERFFELYSQVRPTVVELKPSQIEEVAVVINSKDAPILAGAKMSECRYLVTLDRRHFLTDKVTKFARPTEILLPKSLLERMAK